MRHPFQEWYEIGRRLSRDDLVALIKALTVAERDLPNFCCGSVSPVISLYRFLLDSTQGDFDELRDWVVAHTRNVYLPFGSSRFYPASLAEYHEAVTEREKLRREREEAEEKAKIARWAARQEECTERQRIRQQQRQRRTEIIESLQPLSSTERLKRIVEDSAHLVSFYPPEWALIDAETIREWSPEFRLAAIRRLADRRSGVWKKLRNRLESAPG